VRRVQGDPWRRCAIGSPGLLGTSRSAVFLVPNGKRPVLQQARPGAGVRLGQGRRKPPWRIGRAARMGIEKVIVDFLSTVDFREMIKDEAPTL
jgi:hypothetical protein